MKEKLLKDLMKQARALTSQNGTHGFDHIERVYKTCLYIGTVEKADLDILLPAALLHDVTREEENHAQKSSEKMKTILQHYNQPNEYIEAIAEAISSHSFSTKKHPKTLEAKILSDADKLDALGAMGIYRTALYSGEHSRPLKDFIAHFHDKLLKLEGLLFTDEAKRIASGRTKYMKEFLIQLEKELKQEA